MIGIYRYTRRSIAQSSHSAPALDEPVIHASLGVLRATATCSLIQQVFFWIVTHTLYYLKLVESMGILFHLQNARHDGKNDIMPQGFEVFRAPCENMFCARAISGFVGSPF